MWHVCLELIYALTIYGNLTLGVIPSSHRGRRSILWALLPYAGLSGLVAIKLHLNLFLLKTRLNAHFPLVLFYITGQG